MKWDIFCRVIDNYGDIGVTWRLARQLVADHQISVRLWIDDLSAFVQVFPEGCLTADTQSCAGVEVCHWMEGWSGDVADVVIEAFACHLPAKYIQAMSVSSCKPLWLNLEYLTAEDWVEDCHALPSLQAGGLRKFFFFPGFSSRTGGLLRETALLKRRDAFQADNSAQSAFLRSLGIRRDPGERLISLFGYENPSLADWLKTLSEAEQPTYLVVPYGRILTDVERWAGEDGLEAGDVMRRGALCVHVIPFLSQDMYDQLLWCCDFNVVRGEDSFLRAQWAGRPMLWHIYPQEDGVHRIKLQAFLHRYIETLPISISACLSNCWQAWNDAQDISIFWKALQADEAILRKHALQWSEILGAQSGLSTKLVQFCSDWL